MTSGVVAEVELPAGPDPRAPRTLRDTILRLAVEPSVARPLFALLRAVLPVVRLPGATPTVVVARAAAVREVIDRPDDFTIAEVNAARIERAAGPFILGMDRGETFDRELAVLQAAGNAQDADRIGALVRELAAHALAPRLAAGTIDVANGFARPVALGLTARFLGVPGPDPVTLARWCRSLFEYTFISDGARATKLADLDAPEMADYLRALIVQRREQLDGSADRPDNVLDRLIVAGRDQPTTSGWLDDEAIRRNISGLVVGAVDTTSKATTFAMIELLRRPEQLADAGAAARRGDVDRVRQHVHEALRFRPHQPVVARHCRADTTVGGRRISGGRTVLAATWSARFDPREVANPREYRVDRDLTDDLTFGHGMHECYGRFVNEVSLPLLVGALASLADREAGGRVHWDGPFPDRLELRFRPGQPLPAILG